jgi:hypothetical protein
MQRFRTDTSTTGRVVSTLGVLTVLARNLVEENHLETDEQRGSVMKEIEAIARGSRGVHRTKLMQRCAERCAYGVFN